MGRVPVASRVVSVAVGDARGGLDAEIAVSECVVPRHRGGGVVDVYAVVARADRDVLCQQRFGRCRLDEEPVDRRASGEVAPDRVPDRRRASELFEGSRPDAGLVVAPDRVALDQIAASALERDTETTFPWAVKRAGEPVSGDRVSVARDDDAVSVVREAVAAERVAVAVVEEDPGLRVVRERVVLEPTVVQAADEEADVSVRETSFLASVRS